MLTYITFFTLSVVILFLILAVKEDNLVYAAVSLSLSGVATLFWADGFEVMRSEFVVENASADAVENIGTWVTTTQSYSPHGATAYIPALFAIVSFLVVVYLVLEHFQRSV